MKPLRLTLILSSIVTLLTGCEGYQQAVRDGGHNMGLIMTRDVNHYTNWQTLIYKQSGYTSRQIEITPGSGTTHLTINELRPGEDPSVLASKMRTLAAKDPNAFGLIEVSIQPRH